jgi:hypothetical protein
MGVLRGLLLLRRRDERADREVVRSAGSGR